MSRFINPVPQFFLDDGSLASSGRMKFFVNRDYSTLKDTYSQPDNTIQNTNPVVLDGQGRLPPCFGEGLYSVKFYAYDPNSPDNLGSLQWTRDDVSLSSLTGQFSEFNPIVSYDLFDIVKYSDGNYYQSIKPENKGNTPSQSPVFWSKVVFITEYNENYEYPANYIVSYNGKLYSSNTSGNIGNDPPASQWDNLTFNNAVTGNFSVTGTIAAGSYSGGNLSKTTDAGINLVSKKTTQTSRTSTTTLAADPDLSITNLTVSSFYKVKAFIAWDGNGSTANGIKIRVGVTNATLLSAMYTGNTNTSTANTSPTSNENGGVPTGFNKLPNSASASEVIIIDAVVSTSGSGTPTINIEWAQSASQATATRVNVGSNLTVTKL